MVGDCGECSGESDHGLQCRHRQDIEAFHGKCNNEGACPQAEDDGPTLGRTLFDEYCTSIGGQRRTG